jgi:hypothetical protein
VEEVHVKRFRKQPAKPLDLDASLRRSRPELRSDLLQSLVQRAREDHRERFRPGLVRSALALGLTALVLVAFASVGGFGSQLQVIHVTAASQQYFGNRCGQGSDPKKPPKEPRKCPVQAGNASSKEGSASKPKSLVFPISIGDGLVPDSTVTVQYVIGGGTAIPTVDYTPIASGTLTFLAGQTLKTVSVPIIYTPAPAGDRTVLLTLLNPSANALISLAQGTGTILGHN